MSRVLPRLTVVKTDVSGGAHTPDVSESRTGTCQDEILEAYLTTGWQLAVKAWTCIKLCPSWTELGSIMHVLRHQQESTSSQYLHRRVVNVFETKHRRATAGLAKGTPKPTLSSSATLTSSPPPLASTSVALRGVLPAQRPSRDEQNYTQLRRKKSHSEAERSD